MPKRDRTGPEGEGPMTGWGAGDCAAGNYAAGNCAAGNCADQPAWGYAGPMRGGRARGRGRRWRNQFYATGQPRWAPHTPEQETEALKAQAEWLRGELDAIDHRLGKLENTE